MHIWVINNGNPMLHVRIEILKNGRVTQTMLDMHIFVQKISLEIHSYTIIISSKSF